MAGSIANQIIQGILLGVLYAMCAIGLSLSVGIMRLVNIAHGDLIVLVSFLLLRLRIAPAASFSMIDWTVYIIFIVVIGCVGSFDGPIIGTVIFFLIREYLQSWGIWQFIVLGRVSIAMVMIEPRGFWGLFRRVVPGDLIPVSHTPPSK